MNFAVFTHQTQLVRAGSLRDAQVKLFHKRINLKKRILFYFIYNDINLQRYKTEWEKQLQLFTNYINKPKTLCNNSLNCIIHV